MSQYTAIRVAANGSVIIPAQLRQQMGVGGGGKLIARLVNGALVLEPRDVAIRRARQLVAKCVPKHADLVVELIAERRVDAERE